MRVSLSLQKLLLLGWVHIVCILSVTPILVESMSLRSRSSTLLSKKLSLWRTSPIWPVFPKKDVPLMKGKFPSPLYESDNARTLERPPLKERFASVFASRTNGEEKNLQDDYDGATQQSRMSSDAATNSTSDDVTNSIQDSPLPSSSSSTTTTATSGLLPSYASLIIFTATTILIWLSEPLLSLVDTTIVGLTSASRDAVVQIAALGPATTLFDSAIYVTYFLAIATTNTLAPGLAKKDWKKLRRSTSHIMGLALLFGCFVSAVVFGWGRYLISRMVGSSLTEGNIIPLATNYARIRAVAAPFSVIGFVAQSFCLTILDTKTPALAVAVASIVNVVGDLALSPAWGIQGAAAATALATVTSCLILVAKVRKTMAQWKTKQEVAEVLKEISTEENASTAIGDETLLSLSSSSPSGEGGVESPTDGAVNKPPTEQNSKTDTDIPFWSLPDKASTIDLFKLAGPIFFVMMAKIACYSVMTIRATTFGILPLAAHNIMMRIFFFFACFGDSLSQATQSFYPQVPTRLRGKLLQRLGWIAMVVGLCNHQVSQLILRQLGRIITKDAGIINMMATYSPIVGGAILMHPFIMLLEGTVLAKRDLIFMVGMYILTGLFHFGFVFSPISASFKGLWRALFVFQFIRLVQFALRVWDTSRRER